MVGQSRVVIRFHTTTNPSLDGVTFRNTTKNHSAGRNLEETQPCDRWFIDPGSP